jgi:SAM-dependent methyltransferase/glycosyltransferase involved in cell wall biosynthesis
MTYEKPWMSEEEIAVISRRLHKNDVMLEWGSGGSTNYFPQFVGQYYSIEHDGAWFEQIKPNIANNVNYNFVPVDFPLTPVTKKYQVSTYIDFVDRFKVKKFDKVLIDGRGRGWCAEKIIPYLKEESIVFIHDYWDRPNYHIVEKWYDIVDAVKTGQGIVALKIKKEFFVADSAANHIEQSASGLSCVFVNTYYPRFVENFYQSHPYLATASYTDQLTALQASRFGDADFYSSHLSAMGWQVHDLIVNVGPLQAAWAKEHGTTQSAYKLIEKQLEALQPDVVYLQDLSLATPELISWARRYARLIVGQIASPVPNVDVKAFDLLLSSFPHFVDDFRRQNITAYYQHLAFDERVLEDVAGLDRDIPVSFVGGLSPSHGKGLAFLETLAGLTRMDFWGYGADLLASDSAIRARHHGEVWGIEMFEKLARSQITLNRHIDVAGHFANNMRLFEATGCGALLITDYKDNLPELFEIGKEIVVYRSAEECAALIEYYLSRPDEARKIANAGQARTLRDYSYRVNAEETSAILKRHLHYQFVAQTLPLISLNKISYGKEEIAERQVKKKHLTAWKSESIPTRQRALVQQELSRMFAGDIPLPFSVMSFALQSILTAGQSVLEIGCASGYYAEVIPYLLKKKIVYTGVDYSEALINMARDYYPQGDFQVADGKSLPFDHDCFDVVISSCILLHVTNALEHIQETIRVAKRYIVVHRTPVCRSRSTQYYKKFAYGEETVELRYNEAELLGKFYSQGCRFVRFIEFAANAGADEFEVTYILEKIAGLA